jgi:four helix bundle protein
MPCSIQTGIYLKDGIVVEEADETVFWLEIMVETGLIAEAKMHDLQKEANELLAIFSASLRTARRDFQ